MNVHIANFWKTSLCVLAICCFASSGFPAQAPNPRSGTVQNTVATTNVAPQRASGKDIVSVSNNGAANTISSSRSASNTVSRSATQRPSATVARSASVPTSQNVVNSGRSAVRQSTVSNGSTTSRAASSNVVRSATANNTARAAAASAVVGASRSSMARATAVFDDISKFRDGCKYADCLHIHEDKCNVLSNIDKIDKTRYESYLEFIKEAKEYKEKIKFEGHKQEQTKK